MGVKDGAGLAPSRWPQHRCLPACGLLFALAAVFLFVGERGYFYSHNHNLHDMITAEKVTLAQSLSAGRGFLFFNQRLRANGAVRHDVYNRFPIGGFVLIKLAMTPFDGNFAAQLVAARVLMLAFLCAAAVLAYLALTRLAGSRAIALAASLLAFSSYHPLLYGDCVSTDMSVGLFAVMLVFHGMVVFRGDGRGRRFFWQLAGKVCAALLLDWRVYGLLLPFLALGLVQEGLVGWRSGGTQPASHPPPPLRARIAERMRGVARGILRGRMAPLGAVALLFGAAVLGYNIEREYAAFDGQRTVAELPSVQSMLRKVSISGEPRLPTGWSTFFTWQFHRVGVASVPVALLGDAEMDERALRRSGAPRFFWLGVVATVGAFAGLALLRGPRTPLAALALAGFCWALLVPGHTAWAYHQFDGMFHIGIPLCLATAVLLGVSRLWRRVAAVCAVAAVVVFAGSSVAMDLAHRTGASVGRGKLGAEERRGEARTRQRERMAEFDVIARAIRGRTTWVATHFERIHLLFVSNRVMDFFTMGGLVRYAVTTEIAAPKNIGSFDFVLAFERHDVPGLRTPDHRLVFLYDAAHADALLRAMREARRGEYRRLRAQAPVAQAQHGRGEFEIHVRRGRDDPRAVDIVYIETPCGHDDTKGPFYLQYVVADVDRSLAGAKPADFEHLDIIFSASGVVFDDVCMMEVPLPKWPVARVRVGEIHPDGGTASWRVAFRLDTDRLRAALRAVRGKAPAARAKFDLHLQGGMLLYARAPCAAEDVRSRFFLHVAPEDPAALPLARRAGGFANLDFEFGEHGARFDGACLAMLPLPEYPIARVATGQVDAGGGVAWRTEFAPDGRGQPLTTGTGPASSLRR